MSGSSKFEKMVTKSPAKINLVLDVLKKDQTGYHQIQTVFYEFLNLSDEIKIEDIEKGIKISCNNPLVPLDSTNTIWQAIVLLQSFLKKKRGIKITIKKNIPVGSGLGGGSSNAAATLMALNKLWRLKLSREKLMALGQQIGMDVPFFIKGGVAMGTHYGEKIELLSKKLILPLKVVTFDLAINTSLAYQNLDFKKCGKNRLKTSKLIAGIKSNNLSIIRENIHNDFETLVLAKYPMINQRKKDLEKKGFTVGLSGSGSSLFYW